LEPKEFVVFFPYTDTTNQADENFVEEIEGDGLERACDTLIMCIITTLNNGLRNGGGIGDVLRKPSTSVSLILKIEQQRTFKRH
jgi:hypothetical protein